MGNKAIIGITDWANTTAQLLDVAAKLDAGGQTTPADYRLNFANAAQLLAELPPRRLDTLRTIKRNGPASIYAIARSLGRNYSNVHADTQKLVEHGLVEKDATGLVFVPWDDVVVKVDASLLSAA